MIVIENKREKELIKCTCMQVSSQSWPNLTMTTRSSSDRMAWSTAQPEWRCGNRYDIALLNFFLSFFFVLQVYGLHINIPKKHSYELSRRCLNDEEGPSTSHVAQLPILRRINYKWIHFYFRTNFINKKKVKRKIRYNRKIIRKMYIAYRKTN